MRRQPPGRALRGAEISRSGRARQLLGPLLIDYDRGPPDRPPGRTPWRRGHSTQLDYGYRHHHHRYYRLPAAAGLAGGPDKLFKEIPAAEWRPFTCAPLERYTTTRNWLGA